MLVATVLVVVVLVAAGGGAGAGPLTAVVTAEEAAEVTAETAEVSPLPEGLWSAVAASACRENKISRNSIPAAPITNCAARRATRRVIGRGVTSFPLTGIPIVKRARRATVRPPTYNFADWSRNDYTHTGSGKPHSVMLERTPGGPSPELGAAYIEDVAGFLGTPYVWGGENGFGIYCSGVVRQGLIRANLRLGLAHGNGALLRRALEMTVHDLSAKALGEGARGWTRELFTAPGINDVDERQLQAGDLAITQDGLHVLVYRGAHVWLEADPVRGRVVEDAAPLAQVGWFTVPVRLMRWTQLE